jgi:hypothetical protein
VRAAHSRSSDIKDAMALTIETRSTNTISLEDFLDHVRGTLVVEDPDSLISLAQDLRSLANNRTFLVRRLQHESMSFRTFQAANRGVPETLEIMRGDGWVLRANVWMPLHSSASENEKRSKIYHDAHDHNFSFLTVGYLGPGYATTIYEYDPDRTTGIAGEPVELRFLERTTLPFGKVMLYRACRDVHSQEYPDALSISLNLIAFDPRFMAMNQYQFDLDRRIIRGFQENEGHGRVLLCRLARLLGDRSTIPILEQLSERHPAPRIRVESRLALAALDPSSANATWRKALADPHLHVRTVAQRSLNYQSHEEKE